MAYTNPDIFKTPEQCPIGFSIYLTWLCLYSYVRPFHTIEFTILIEECTDSIKLPCPIITESILSTFKKLLPGLCYPTRHQENLLT